MKKLTALSIYLFFSIALLAQDYRPFPTTNAYWAYVVNTGNGGSGLPQTAVLVYRQFMLTGADTLINGTNYKTIVKREYRDSASNAVPAYSNKIANVPDEIVLALREDNKKVYAVLFPATTEVLLYDFSKIIGDTMNYLPTSIRKEIRNSDSVLIGAKYHKRWLTDHAATDVIEGVGSMQGILGMMNGQNTVDLACFNNGAGTYSYGNASCFYIYKQGTPAGVTAIENLAEVSVGPNPFSNKLTIKSGEPIDIMLYNSQGQALFVQSQVRLYDIDTHALPAGLYFAEIKDKGTRRVIKLVK